MILPLVNGSIGKQFFLVRPRRFGKSLLVSTLHALFEGKRELFKGLDIEPKWDWSKSWPVIHLDMGTIETETVAEFRQAILDLLRKEAVRLQVKPCGNELPSSAFDSLIVVPSRGDCIDTTRMNDKQEKALQIDEPLFSAFRVGKADDGDASFLV